jgi:hypothetical protein
MRREGIAGWDTPRIQYGTARRPYCAAARRSPASRPMRRREPQGGVGRQRIEAWMACGLNSDGWDLKVQAMEID